MMRSSSSRPAFALLFVSLALSGRAAADAETDALVEQGIQARRERRDVEALSAFEAAYARDPQPRTRAQIALAKQALARWADAERDLADALRQNDPWIVQRREALEQSLAKIRDHLGSVRVQSNVEKVDVTVNGTALGPLPSGPLRVVAGEVVIELTAPGYQTRRLTVLVAPSRTVEAVMNLEPRPQADAAPSAVPGTTASVAAQPAADRAQQHANASDPRETAAWIAAVGAGVFLTGGVVTQIIGERAASRYNDDNLCVYGSLSREERCGSYGAQASAARTAAVIGYGLAGLSAAASAYLFVTSRAGARANVGSNQVAAEFWMTW